MLFGRDVRWSPPFLPQGVPWRGVASAFPWRHQLRKGHLMCPPERAASRHRDQISWQTASSRFGVSGCMTFFEHAELVVECWVGSIIWFWWRSAGSRLGQKWQDWSSRHCIGTWPACVWLSTEFLRPHRGPPCRAVSGQGCGLKANRVFEAQGRARRAGGAADSALPGVRVPIIL